ncbi:PadR family transcriptional regulator [Glaciibacter superstes]|uniref:PadR family transcriptional regulator n=1 Tax=Glaciibacter superstes TaxID=501023 RepID=UPI0003B3D321|nr:PadR family transcriptional regulator [Glaciibacter superstes]
MGSSENKVLTNLRKGVLEFCLLALLRDGEWYGLDIARRLSQLGLLAGEGTVYPLLSRLRRSGLVTTEWSESDVGRPRRYYTLTELGRENLREFTEVWGPFRSTVDEILETES